MAQVAKIAKIAEIVPAKRASANANNVPAKVAKSVAKAKAKPVKAKVEKVETPVIVAETRTKPSTWLNSEVEKQRDFVSTEMVALSNADADKMIKMIRTSGKTLRSMAHKTACGILLHYQEHGDYTKIYPLLSAIRDSMGRGMATGLVKWVRAFSTLRYDEKTLTFTHVKGEKAKFWLTGDSTYPEKTPRYSGALNVPFYGTGYGDAPAPHSFDIQAYLEKEFQRIAKKIEGEIARKFNEKTSKAEAKRIKVDRDDLKQIEAVAKTLHVKIALTPETTPAGNA